VSHPDIAPCAIIHSTAIVEPGARIGDGTEIGPYSIIGRHVRLGQGNRVGAHVVIDGHTTLGDDNQIFPFASLGASPQDLKWAGETTTLTVGDRNIIREYVTMQPGTAGGAGSTIIGNDNLFMANSHVAHDCRLGNHIHLTNSTALAGHIDIGDFAILSGLVGVHQFVRIGRLAFVSGGAMVAQDVPPFSIVQGDRARLVGLNQVGLTRQGVPGTQIADLRRAWRLLFLARGGLAERIAAADCRSSPMVQELVAFVTASRRGIVSTRQAALAT